MHAAAQGPGILVIATGAGDALARDLAASLDGEWRVTSVGAPDPRVGLPVDGNAAVFLVMERPEASVVAGWLAALGREKPPLIVATGEACPRELARLAERGVADFVVHPFRRADVQARLLRLVGTARPDPLVERLKAKLGLRRLVGQSAAFVAAVERIAPLAGCDANVLLTGETGTGKEVFARAIHHLSARARQPFVAVNCGAIPLELVENELFGHAPEAYTGAARTRQGLIREAEGGTLFLDEIDALPAASQVKLLRFLQEKEYRALGSPEVKRADVRLIAASNTRVEEEVAQGRLRRDLYYRLNVLPLALPPLRERSEDVLLLARHFLARHAAALGRPAPRLGPAACQALVEHDWPGNVRELEHVMERAVILAAERSEIGEGDVLLPVAARQTAVPGSFREAKGRAVASFERGYLERLLLAHGGNISRAARAAGKNRRAFFELVRKHGIEARRFRGPGPASGG